MASAKQRTLARRSSFQRKQYALNKISKPKFIAESHAVKVLNNSMAAGSAIPRTDSFENLKASQARFLKHHLDQPFFDKENKPNFGLFAQVALILENAGLIYLGQLIQMNNAQILAIKDIGTVRLQEIKVCAKNFPNGVTFGMDVEGWVPPK